MHYWDQMAFHSTGWASCVWLSIVLWVYLRYCIDNSGIS